MVTIYLILTHILLLSLQFNIIFGFDVDVKCAIYEGSDEENGNNADVRILALGLNVNSTYVANVMPDHNPPVKVISMTDKEGIFWTIAKVPNGEKSLFFNVDIYEGTSVEGKLVASGDDEAPCYKIAEFKKK